MEMQTLVLWSMVVLLSITILYNLYSASKGTHTIEVKPGSVAVAAVIDTILLIGLLVYCV
jgi:uncharacterized membrane protein